MSDKHQVSFIGRVKESFHDSFGEIVFGMSDGTVSIFGLVAGMVAGAQSGDVIVLAGATAAIAATVSMMAGSSSISNPNRIAQQLKRKSGWKRSKVIPMVR